MCLLYFISFLPQPKTELPDYNSDGETRGDANAYLDQSSYAGMSGKDPQKNILLGIFV